MLLFCGILGAVGYVRAADPHAGDWPQWRGPTRDGMVGPGVAWPDSLDEQHLASVWQVPLAPSYSGPIVVGDRVFVTETRDAKTEVVQALSRSTGAQLWEVQWPGAISVPFFARENGSWIRSTPACDGDALYVAGMRDVLVCLDVATGSERWRKDFVAEFQAEPPAFGFVSSPLVRGDFVYVQAGGAFVKLHKRTGELVWRSMQDGGGMNGSAFSSPTHAVLGGKAQLVVQSRERLVGVDEETGTELWAQTVPAFRGMNILTPVVIGDSIFTSSYGGQAWLYGITAGDSLTVVERWQNKTQAYMSTPVVIDGHIYCHLKNQRFACINIKTGEEQWITKPYGKYWSLVAQGTRILALDERGELLLIRANPESFELLDVRKVSETTAWAHLAVAGDQVFVRNLRSLEAFQWKSP